MIKEATYNSDVNLSIWGRNQQEGAIIDLIERWTEFHVDLKWGDMSTWQLSMPYAEFNSVFKPAATDPITKFSIAAYRNNEINPLISGPITEATRDWHGADDMLHLTGLCDLWWLQSRVMPADWQYWPTQDSWQPEYIKYCGYPNSPIESVMRNLLYYYYGSGQPSAWRKIPYFDSGYGHAPAYGQNIAYWARWETGFEMCKKCCQMATTGTGANNYLDAEMSFDIVNWAQAGASRYGFMVYAMTNLSNQVTFGTDLGTVDSFSYTEKKPGATLVIGGGPDLDPNTGAISQENGYRLYHASQNNTIYDLYGGVANHNVASAGRIEEFFDTGSVETGASVGNPTKAQIVAWMRDKTNAELKLKQYNATVEITLEPSDMIEFGTLSNFSGEFRLGCKVAVRLNNMSLTELIREMKLDFTPEKGEIITPIVCDAFQFYYTKPMPFASENRWQLGEIGRNWR